MVAQAFNLCEFKVSPVYRVSSRIVRPVTQRNSIEEKKLRVAAALVSLHSNRNLS